MGDREPAGNELLLQEVAEINTGHWANEARSAQAIKWPRSIGGHSAYQSGLGTGEDMPGPFMALDGGANACLRSRTARLDDLLKFVNNQADRSIPRLRSRQFLHTVQRFYQQGDVMLGGIDGGHTH